MLDQIIYWDGQNWARSCNFNGSDLSHVEVPPQICGSACRETEGSTHYAWTTLNGGTCWMKTGTVSKADAFPTNDSTMVCGINKNGQEGVPISNVHWNGQNWATSCNFHGNVLSHVETKPELCDPACFQNQECTHYTWTTLNDGTCWMKTGNVSKADAFSTNDTTMVCGVNKDDQSVVPISTVQWNEQSWARSCDFPGNELSHVKVSSDFCGPTCARAKDCIHYTWTIVNDGTCWMKTGIVSKDNTISTNDPDMIFGVAVTL
ncbi:unnamed protein product [Rotaria sp. Silwood2]|nr:unnamed protein product [Rotaria sp. Silwood2]